VQIPYREPRESLELIERSFAYFDGTSAPTAFDVNTGVPVSLFYVTMTRSGPRSFEPEDEKSQAAD
jgi:hypothetical protein